MTVKELEAYLFQQIPVSKALDFHIIRADHELVEIAAPLAININHLGTAFGGSLNTLLVLACYTWLFQVLEHHDPQNHVILKNGNIDYLKPVKEDIHAICRSPGKPEFERFLKTFKQKGRGKIHLEATVTTREGEACRFMGEFVAQSGQNPSPT